MENIIPFCARKDSSS